MAALSEEDRGRIVKAILVRKFGDLLEWQQPELFHCYGTNDLGFVDDFSANLGKTIIETRSDLATFSDEDLRQAEVDLTSGGSDPIADWYEISLLQIRKLGKQIPPAIAFGFGHPKYEVDLEYWGSMPELSLSETVCLSVGASPEALPDSKIEELLSLKKKGKELWSAYELLLRRHELFRGTSRSTDGGARPNQVR